MPNSADGAGDIRADDLTQTIGLSAPRRSPNLGVGDPAFRARGGDQPLGYTGSHGSDGALGESGSDYQIPRAGAGYVDPSTANDLQRQEAAAAAKAEQTQMLLAKQIA